MRILAGATTALRRVVDLVLVVLIVVVLFGLILGKLVPLTGRQTIIVGGGSMEPAIQLGAAIVIRPVEPGALVVGDVVSMQVGPRQAVFTHRIITIVDRTDGQWIRTQGDSNAAPDPTLVPASAVIGRMELVVPYAGYLLALLSLPLGVMFILGLAATLLATAWLLESLELEPKTVRAAGSARSRADEAPGTGPGLGANPGAAGRIDDYLRGEPIATGRALAGGSSAALPGTALAIAAISPGSRSMPSRHGWAEATGRPTVRGHFERTREMRERRASWLRGGRGPID